MTARLAALSFAVLAVCAAPAAAQVSFVGDWSGRYHEDQLDRIPGEEPGDFSGVPLNDAARMYGDSWDQERFSVLEEQCAPYTLPYMFFGPNQIRISERRDPDTQELIAIEMYLGTYQQRRTIWMDGRPHPPDYMPYTYMGFSTGEWNGDVLTVTTTHIKAGFFRRTGIPASDRVTVVEHWIRHGNLLSQVTIATDPVYLTEPYIRSQEFVLMDRNNTNWLYNCEYAQELPGDKHKVPHYLPGQNPWRGEFAAKHAMPEGGVRGGAETLLPEWTPGAPPAAPRPNANGGFRPENQPSKLAPGDVRSVHVQGNVYMVVGAGANIAVQVGEDGILVVDTGAAGTSGKVLDAIKALAPGKEIRWLVNTTISPDHIGGNEPLARAGRTVNGNVAAIIAHENAAARMIDAGVPAEARPYNTYFDTGRDFPFNGEPVIIMHPASATTDADSMVMFRRSDVIAAGDVFGTETYPVIDVARGGSIDGTIDAVNHILDLTVPSKMLEEGGTWVIPGHGRISDEHDVVMYRDMLVIIRDRIRDSIDKGMTLEQIEAARPTLDYDGRYAAASGPSSTAGFIEAIYRSLRAAPKTAGLPAAEPALRTALQAVRRPGPAERTRQAARRPGAAARTRREAIR
ncbi:MAG TPA: MBL fold metallo-hydrolase [Vicinamibacterales bacterium]|nr:MBL fold metallo-hydrolase [Vicinamibacterales bacterium]